MPHTIASRALTRQPQPEGWQLSRRTGEDPEAVISAGRTAVRRAISVPLTLVTSGLSRSLADTSHRRSGRTTARMAQIPKLIVRVRFPSPAPRVKPQVKAPIARASRAPVGAVRRRRQQSACVVRFRPHHQLNKLMVRVYTLRVVLYRLLRALVSGNG
jgi:hypothetical protein